MAGLNFINQIICYNSKIPLSFGTVRSPVSVRAVGPRREAITMLPLSLLVSFLHIDHSFITQSLTVFISRISSRASLCWRRWQCHHDFTSGQPGRRRVRPFSPHFFHTFAYLTCVCSPYTCAVSTDGGSRFASISVVKNVPGIMSFSFARAKDFTLIAQMPE